MTDDIRVVYDLGGLSEALACDDSFVAYAPLGHRGQVRGLICGIAGGMGRRVQVSLPWYGLVEPRDGETYGDYFYVLVGATGA